MSDLERFMKSMKITQNDLATKLGVSQAAISKVKIGQMDIPKNWVEIISLLLRYISPFSSGSIPSQYKTLASLTLPFRLVI